MLHAVPGSGGSPRSTDGRDRTSAAEGSGSVTLWRASAARMSSAFAFRIAIIAYFGEWLSLVEHLVRDQGVGGSNPLSPTNYLQADAAFSRIAKNPDVDDFVAVKAFKINRQGCCRVSRSVRGLTVRQLRFRLLGRPFSRLTTRNRDFRQCRCRRNMLGRGRSGDRRRDDRKSSSWNPR